jgi:ribosomal protein L21E
MWSMEQFSRYLDEYQGKGDYVQTVLEPRIKQIMQHCFDAAKPRLSAKFG